MRHCYLFSIKNRFSFFKPLILQLKDIYKSFPEKLFISVTDFNSDDACISTFLSELDVDFSYRCFDENFNLGKGWNLASEHEEISNNDILVFLTNDTTVGNIDLPATIEKYTNQHNSIFIPVHAMETKNKDFIFGGGACLWSLYKSDFLKIGNVPESETWSDAHKWAGGRCGEDDFFVFSAKTKGFKVHRCEEKGIIAKWHPRDMNNPWYGNSKCMKERKITPQNCPKWWTIIPKND